MRAACTLAALFLFCSAPTNAALPPIGFLDNEVRLEEDHRLYGQPLNVEEARKVVVEEYRPTDFHTFAPMNLSYLAKLR
jgi:hypothetical protein